MQDGGVAAPVQGGSTTPDFDYVFKLLVIGDCGVGKSALLRRFVDGEFSAEYTTTIGVDFGTRTCTVSGKKVKLQIWDTAGSERFRAVTSGYYRGAHGIIIVFDVGDRRSFEDVKYWIGEAGRFAPASAQRLLVGNKCDLEGPSRLVTREDALELSDELGVPLVEASAMSSQNVEQAFLLLAEAVRETATREMPAVQSLETAPRGVSSQNQAPLLGPAMPMRRRGLCRACHACLRRVFARIGIAER
mmetsp:Transcript_2240/g.5036  ORF Transcript_2240/g.5036 Transcript_2240/m.5036 type:complete len:246 (-) Transcript_2240:29-766(-)